MIHVFHNDHQNRRKIFPYQVVLDNIRSAFNVGSILRNADAFGCERLHFVGITPKPDHEKVIKTAKGTTESIECQYWIDPHSLYKEAIENHYYLYSLETTDQSVPLSKVEFKFPCCVVLGHEVAGVSEYLLKRSTEIIEIPLWGLKNSINVSVASGILFNHLVSVSA